MYHLQDATTVELLFLARQLKIIRVVLQLQQNNCQIAAF